MTVAATASGADLPLRAHVLRTLRLAGPVMLARAGLLIMISVDTIMCGRVAARELAYYGIALASPTSGRASACSLYPFG